MIPEDFKPMNAVAYAKVTAEGLKQSKHFHTRHQRKLYSAGFKEHYCSDGNYFFMQKGNTLIVGREASKSQPGLLKFGVFYPKLLADKIGAEETAKFALEQVLKDQMLDLSDKVQSPVQHGINL